MTQRPETQRPGALASQPPEATPSGRRGPRTVALGGGHGLAASLGALRQLTDDLTAVVTVADDGGSSGRLRAAYPDLIPPGDLRMALDALAGDGPDAALIRDVVQHRLPAGDPGLEGHPVGNLFLTGLFQTAPDPVSALVIAGRLLGLAPGTRVLPMSTGPLDIEADVAGLPGADDIQVVRGQVEVATTPGHVMAVRLVPAAAPATPEALTALAEAELVVLGPGSLFTSVLPHLMHAELGAAIAASPARRVLVLNLAPQEGETDGFAPESHLEVLLSHAPDLDLDLVLADVSAVLDRRGLMGGLTSAAEDVGARLHLAPLARRDQRDQHDPVALAEAFRRILDDRPDARGPLPAVGQVDEHERAVGATDQRTGEQEAAWRR